VRSHRPAAVQQRVIESLIDRVLRFAGRRALPAGRRPRPRLQRSAVRQEERSPDSTPCSATQPSPESPVPPPRCAALDRTGAPGTGEERARLLHFRPPLAKYRARWELFGTRTTATLACGAPKVTLRRSSRGEAANLQEDGGGYARLTLEDFHGGRRRWSSPRLGQAERRDSPDGAYLVTGGYIARDQGEEQAPVHRRERPRAR